MPYISADFFPMSKDAARTCQSALFILGLTSSQIGSWIVFSSGAGAEDANIAFTSRILQVVGLIAVLAIDRKLKYGAFSIAAAFNIAAFLAMVGAVLFFIGEADILRHCGPCLHGSGSALAIVGWGFYSCTMNPARSSFNLIQSSVITGIVVFLLWDMPLEILVIFAVISPILSGICFSALMCGALRKKLSADRTIHADSFSRLPKVSFVLLLSCTSLCTAAKMIIHGELALSATEASRIVWPAAMIGFFAIYMLWRQTPKGKRIATSYSWALSPFIVVIGLLGYSAFSRDELVWTTVCLNATSDCLFLFCWIFTAQLVFRYKLPKVASFTILLLVFACPQLILSLLEQLAILEPSGIPTSMPDLFTTFVHALCLVVVIVAPAIAGSLIEARPKMETELSPPANHHEPLKERIAELADTYSLTGREMDVATCLAQGCTLRQTGEELYISLDTVRTHSKNLYAKLNIHKKQELIDLVNAEQR